MFVQYRFSYTYDFLSSSSVLNKNNYNFLKCGWSINCCGILHQLICKAVIGKWAEIQNRISASRSSHFINHLNDYRQNWTPLSPITII